MQRRRFVNYTYYRYGVARMSSFAKAPAQSSHKSDSKAQDYNRSHPSASPYRASEATSTAVSPDSSNRTAHSAETAPEAAHGAPAIVNEVLRSPGEPLDPAAQTSLAARFGHDFSTLAVHTDAASQRAVAT